MVIYKVRTGPGKFKTISTNDAKGKRIIEITTQEWDWGETDTVIYLEGEVSEGS